MKDTNDNLLKAACRSWRDVVAGTPKGVAARTPRPYLACCLLAVLLATTAYAGPALATCESRPGEGPEMVVIDAGAFEMGENPTRRVTIARPFALARCEVTFAEYDRFADEVGRAKPEDENWGRGNRPVINVGWEDARAYALWLSLRTGHRYRLPTEAEWEYAARGGTTEAYWWGDEASHEFANYGKDECCDGHAEGRDEWINTAPAGSFPTNPFGLHDMHGNVWEWAQDCWHDTYDGAPDDGSAWLSENNGDCSRRVLRGGSWDFSPQFLRSALRNWNTAGDGSVFVGFRLARDL